MAGCVVSKKRKNRVQFLALCRGEVTGEWHVERERERGIVGLREREREKNFLLTYLCFYNVLKPFYNLHTSTRP